MEWLFGRKMSPDEMLRKNQRALTKAMRELDRERIKMEQQEKKIIADIKKMAKAGQMDAVKIMAKVTRAPSPSIILRSKQPFVPLHWQEVGGVGYQLTSRFCHDIMGKM
jgi:hypothetical protein